jgi:hypothetical protein
VKWRYCANNPDSHRFPILASIPDGCVPPSLSSVRLTKVGQPRYTDFMRVVELRFLLALILVLLGATFIVGLNLGDDTDTMTLQGRTRRLPVNPEEKALASGGRQSSALHRLRTDSEGVPRSGASVIDLVCTLRC